MPEPEFDFDAFVEQIIPTRITVEVSAVDRSEEIERLRELLEDMPEDAATDKRAAQKSPRTAILSRIHDLQSEEENSPGIEFELRPLSPDEWRDLQNRGEGGEDTRYLQLSQQCVKPVLSEDQWRALGDKLGLPRFARILTAATSLTLREGKSPAFSQSVSAGRRNSSKN